MMKHMTRSVFDRKMALEIIGGENRFGGNKHTMKKTREKGVYKIGGSLYNFHGFEQASAGTRNIGHAAAGAVVGGLLTGGLGAVVGGAFGGRKKNNATAAVVFSDVSSGGRFVVVINCDNYLRDRLAYAPIK